MVVMLNKRVSFKCTMLEWLTIRDSLTPYIVVENKDYVNKLNMGISVKDVKQEFSLANIEIKKDAVYVEFPIGLWDYVQHLFVNWTVWDHRNNVKVNADRLIEFEVLYPYQKQAVRNMLPYSNGILKAAPGSGKTMMGLTLGMLKGKSILWINDRIELCKQALKTAVDLLGFPEAECGLLQGDNENVKKYTFTTIQKLHKVINNGFNDVTQKLIHFDTIIIDECHHCVGSYNDYKEYFQVLNEMSYTNLYGLTATEKRVDGNEHLVFAIIGKVRYEVKGELKVMKADVYNKHCHIDTTEEVYESFVNKYTQKAMPAAIDSYLLFHQDYLNFVSSYIDMVLKDYNKVLLVSPRIAGAQYISDYLTAKGVDHFLVYGAIKKRDKMYTTKVLVATIDLVKEGFDVPELEAILVLSREIHKLKKTQIIGRCERYVEGKKSPVTYFLIPHMKRTKKTGWEELSLNEI